MSIYLSKTKYCKAIQCNKILWLDKYKPEVKEEIDLTAVFETGHEVGELAKNIFGEYKDIPYSDCLQDMISLTEKYMEEKIQVITEASFSYNNNFCSIDILKNNDRGIEIYEVKSSTKVSDIYLEDIAYQVYVLIKLGYNVQKASIVYINNSYVRQGQLDLNQLFIIEDVTDIVKSKQEEVKTKIREINEYMEQTEEPNKDIDTYCENPYMCCYWKYCSRHLPEKNVFHIKNMKTEKKYELYHNGLFSYESLVGELQNQNHIEQIEFELYNKEPKIDTHQIKEFLKKISFPLYFLDFETFQQAIPQYNGLKPFEQIPFQYSLHYIEQENGELKHTEFLSETGVDPRRALAERLIKDIPEDVCVLAYNMQFEKMVIKNLANNYKDLSNSLNKIYDNIQDLMIPFAKKMYYTKEMEGSYSIKYVLPALFPGDDELDYNKLPLVHNGGDAMATFATLDTIPKNEQKEIRNGLLEYCKLDTLAMVKIYEKLKMI